MIRHWSFRVEGTAAGGHPWRVIGEIEADPTDLMHRILSHSFQALTNGKAIYGHPGVGCKGPYEILTLHVERIDETYLR